MKSTDDSEDKTTATPPPKFRNRDAAISQVCQAFAALGTLAGIRIDDGKRPDDIDPELIEAAYQSNFDDPHFLGGPACFHYATTTDDVDAIAAKARVVTQGFASYIRNQGRPETLQKAEAHISVIDAAIAWLRKTRRSP